jgi:hypothetical protein
MRGVSVAAHRGFWFSSITFAAHCLNAGSGKDRICAARYQFWRHTLGHVSRISAESYLSVAPDRFWKRPRKIALIHTIEGRPAGESSGEEILARRRTDKTLLLPALPLDRKGNDRPQNRDADLSGGCHNEAGLATRRPLLGGAATDRPTMLSVESFFENFGIIVAPTDQRILSSENRCAHE